MGSMLFSIQVRDGEPVPCRKLARDLARLGVPETAKKYKRGRATLYRWISESPTLARMLSEEKKKAKK